MTALRFLDCVDCGAPAAVILPRAYSESDEHVARRGLVVRWRRALRLTPQPSEPTLVSVVYVNDADAIWLKELGYEHEADSWCEVQKFDGPTWWINKRRRFALRWDCCSAMRAMV